MTQNPAHMSFFRASGWLVIATTIGGVGMFLVQVVAVEWLSPEDYGLMNALFQTLNLAMIPALGLQTVFAQQAASATSSDQKYQTALTAQRVIAGLTAIWFLLALGFILSQNIWMEKYKSASALPLWLTLGAVLPQVCLPVWMGILQGQQSFFWLGNGVITNGIGRFLAAVILVGFLGYGVSGAVGAALGGLVISMIICLWRVEQVEKVEGVRLDWGDWLRRIVPLTLGLGSSTFFLGYDMIVVRMEFEESLTGYYGAAGLCGRGLVVFTIPIAQVMFPRVVKMGKGSGSTAGVLRQTFLATGGLAVFAGIVVTSTVFVLDRSMDGSFAAGARILNHLNAEQMMKLEYISRLAPGFVWAMTPLCLANVLINHLIATRYYRDLWLLISVTISYGTFLMFWTPDSLSGVILVIGVFSTLLLLAATYSIFGHFSSKKK